MKDAIDFLDRIEGHGYGGMADYEIARTTVRDAADEIERLTAGHEDYVVRANANVCELLSEIERLRLVEKAARTVVETFQKDEAQGYRSGSRVYALDMLAHHFRG